MAIAPSSHVVSPSLFHASAAKPVDDTLSASQPSEADQGLRQVDDIELTEKKHKVSHPKRSVAASKNSDVKDTYSCVFHRIAEVRQQQGISIRTVVRKTGIEARELRRQENPSTNLTLSQLQVWQRVLEVPLADLLVDSDQPLSPPIQQRAQLLKIMKTTLSIDEHADNQRVKRLTTMLKEQLVALMPELSEVTAWPTYGQRRGAESSGRIEEQQIQVRSLHFEHDGD